MMLPTVGCSLPEHMSVSTLKCQLKLEKTPLKILRPVVTVQAPSIQISQTVFRPTLDWKQHEMSHALGETFSHPLKDHYMLWYKNNILLHHIMPTLPS